MKVNRKCCTKRSGSNQVVPLLYCSKKIPWSPFGYFSGRQRPRPSGLKPGRERHSARPNLHNGAPHQSSKGCATTFVHGCRAGKMSSVPLFYAISQLKQSHAPSKNCKFTLVGPRDFVTVSITKWKSPGQSYISRFPSRPTLCRKPLDQWAYILAIYCFINRPMSIQAWFRASLKMFGAVIAAEWHFLNHYTMAHHVGLTWGNHCNK